jgi:hypothetical protein
VWRPATGDLPAVADADKMLKGVTCIRLDASVVPAHSDKEGAEPNFKGGGHPLLAYCDNTVRHEALQVRVEVRDLRWPAVAAAG